MKKSIPPDKTTVSDKIVFFASIGTTAFLLLLYLNSTVFKSDIVLTGVFQELMTLPCILAQPILLFLAIRGFYLNKYKIISYPLTSAIIVLIAFIITWGSFF